MQKTLDKLKAAKPVTIVVVGDSISIDTPWTLGRKNWVGYLAEALWATYGDGLVTMINSSRCGNSSGQELQRMEHSILRFKPDLTILSLGLGDTPSKSSEMENSADRARQLITAVQRSGSEVLVLTSTPIVYGYWDPLPPGARSGEAFDTEGLATAWAARLTSVGHELGCVVVDHFSLWKKHRIPYKSEASNPQGLRMRMGPDTVHPGPVGHMALFRDMAPVFGVPRYFPWEDVRDASLV